MAEHAESVEILVEDEDLAELDRLVAYFGDPDRSAFLRRAIRVMTARAQAEES